jgi:hypothetical protein
LRNDKDGSGRTLIEGAEAPNNSTSVSSLEHVLYMDPEVLRARLQNISPQRQPARWAEENLKLGANLQQRARREKGAARVRIFTEAIETFEAALGIYCKCNPRGEGAGGRHPPGSARSSEGPRTEGAIEGVIAFASRPVLSSSLELQESIDLFEEACSNGVRETDFETWVLNSINLGCALVLAGKCDSASGSTTRLEEAMQVCCNVLNEPRIASMPYERAAAYINLAEAMTSLADVSFPDERVDYLDRALRSLAAALVAVAPAHLTSLLETESGANA